MLSQIHFLLASNQNYSSPNHHCVWASYMMSTSIDFILATSKMEIDPIFQMGNWGMLLTKRLAQKFPQSVTNLNGTYVSFSALSSKVILLNFQNLREK